MEGNWFSINAIFIIVRFILVARRNMDEDNSCLQWYFGILWKSIFLYNDYKNTSIPQLHSETVPSWSLLKNGSTYV